MERANPCLRCGACCTLFRVSFYWTESDEVTPGGVPAELTEVAPIPHRLMMKGTGTAPVRCVALKGNIGGEIGCSIHTNRPSVCRDFPASYEDGVTPNPRCDAAREKFAMAPLRPEDWEIHPPDNEPMRPAA